MAVEQDWRDSMKYYLSPEQARAVKMRSIARYGKDTQSTVCMEECAELIQAISKVKRYNPEYQIEIYGLKLSDLRRMMDHKVWRMKRKLEAQGEKF